MMKQEDWYVNKHKEDHKTKEEYIAAFGRLIAPSEIVIEFDMPCPDTELAAKETLFALGQADYNVEEWMALGMKSPHLHIKNIEGLAELADPLRRRYKELFIKKYVLPHSLSYVDMALCAKHRIAEELKPHCKYGTRKIKTLHIGRLETNRVEDHLVRRAEIELKKETFTKRHYPPNYCLGDSIIKIAEEAGIEVNSAGMALCPWHDDNNPSLGFDDERGLFHCFACDVGGNAGKFIEMLKEVKKNEDHI